MGRGSRCLGASTPACVPITYLWSIILCYVVLFASHTQYSMSQDSLLILIQRMFSVPRAPFICQVSREAGVSSLRPEALGPRSNSAPASSEHTHTHTHF